jgi:hypothetical protein
MKPLSISTVAIATAFFILCTSFHPLPKTSSSREIIKPVTSSQLRAATRQGDLFWYIDNGTEYVGYLSVEDETDALEEQYDVLVDTNPDGGTLLASGYPFYGLPHSFFASAFLYGHF